MRASPSLKRLNTAAISASPAGVAATRTRRPSSGSRRRHAGDGRLVRVATTAAGDALMARLFASFNAGEARIVAALDEGESRQLAHLLRKVLRSMEEVVS